MRIKNRMGTLAISAPALLLIAQAAGGRFDGNWTTHLACEAHGETPAYKFVFPSVIKDSKFHAVHGQEDGPGYLVIDGPIADDGSAKLKAAGTVTQSHAHGVFAVKGNHYDYNIKAQFTETKGTGTREQGVGILAALVRLNSTSKPTPLLPHRPPSEVPVALRFPRGDPFSGSC